MLFRTVIVGDELLSGKRQDKHLGFLIAALRRRGLSLAEARYVGDDENLLTQTFRETFASGDVVFSFGGIGGTPDDVTRQCAARAAAVPIVLHSEAFSILEGKFGADVYPHRIRMAELPQGATLIPNPVNQVPGFSLNHHHFVPGFPNMAHPMVEWVLETCYHEWFREEADIEITLLTEEAPESRLIPILETVLAAHPQVHIASLPNTSHRQQVELGVKGQRGWVEPAAEMLMEGLKSDGIRFSRIQECSE